MRAGPSAPRLSPFPLGDVELGEASEFVRARDGMLRLARAYPVDRLLAVFRANAGLDTRGALPPGGWEGFGHPAEEAWGEHDYPGRDRAQTANLLRGHYAGHFLSMLSIAAQSEGDPVLREKVDEMVSGLGEVQRALAATGRFSHPGFLAAYGEWQFARLEHFAPYGEIWAPYYTCHKLMAGLLDAYELAGSRQALEIATEMGRWVAQRVGRLDRDRLQRMWSLYIAGEYGGMNETLARLADVADAPELLEAASAFEQDSLIVAGVRGDDVLTGMHANQHLPQLIGYVHQYELTGEGRYLAAAIGVWGMVVPRRVFAHGGTGESELWGPPGVVAGDIGLRNAETCATYNLLKLARLLFMHTRDPQFMDYYERASLNHVLASRRAADSETSPEVAYMFPVNPGAVPEYDNIGTCCGGTGLENHAKHQDTVFLRTTGGDAELWVNLLRPARLRWRELGADVTVERADPWSPRTTLRVLPDRGDVEMTLRVRIPAWAGGGVALLMNGEEVDGAALPGEYAELRRVWRASDVLEVVVPMALRAEPTIDDPALVSIRFGPHLLVARDPATTMREVAVAARRRLDGTLIADDDGDVAAQLRREGRVRIDGLPFEPVWTGADEPYHMYVRSTASEIAFAGVSSGVPARRGEDGRTVLDAIEDEPAPDTISAFRDRVLKAVVAARRDGLLTRDEMDDVLAAAAGAHGGGAASCVVTAGVSSSTWSEERREGTRVVVWTVPPESDEVSAPPSVRIEVDGQPASSGWFTEVPAVRVEAIDPGGDTVRREIRIGDGPWREASRPFEVRREGVVVIDARATTSAGRVSTARREVAIDTTAPEVDAQVRILGANAEIGFTARDDVSGVARIQWGSGETFWATFQEAFVRSLTDGEQVLEFAATDRAGNESPRRRLVLPARGA